MITEAMIEKEVSQSFENLGWKTSFNQKYVLNGEVAQMCPDLIIEAENMPRGIVEIKTVLSMKKKNALEQVRYMISVLKPDYFYFTNGIQYDLYVKGVLVGCYPTPLTPEETRLFLEE